MGILSKLMMGGLSGMGGKAGAFGGLADAMSGGGALAGILGNAMNRTGMRDEYEAQLQGMQGGARPAGMLAPQQQMPPQQMQQGVDPLQMQRLQQMMQNRPQGMGPMSEQDLQRMMQMRGRY